MVWKVQSRLIKIYVTHNAYYVESYKYAEVDRPYDELTSAYFNLLEALLFAKSINLTHIHVISPSRAIDEINGVVSFSDESFRQTMHRNILPYIIDIVFEKRSEEEVTAILQKAGDAFGQSETHELVKNTNQEIQKHSRFIRAEKFRRSHRI